MLTSRGRAGLLFSVQHTGIDNMIAITVIVIIIIGITEQPTDMIDH